MVDIETTIALAFVTCVANLDAYELHPGDWKIFNDIIDKC